MLHLLLQRLPSHLAHSLYELLPNLLDLKDNNEVPRHLTDLNNSEEKLIPSSPFQMIRFLLLSTRRLLFSKHSMLLMRFSNKVYNESLISSHIQDSSTLTSLTFVPLWKMPVLHSWVLDMEVVKIVRSRRLEVRSIPHSLNSLSMEQRDFFSILHEGPISLCSR